MTKKTTKETRDRKNQQARDKRAAKKAARSKAGAMVSGVSVMVDSPAVPPTIDVFAENAIVGRQPIRTEAARLGASAVRYLRIHAKHPYGARGEQAIVDIAKAAWHAARVESAAV